MDRDTYIAPFVNEAFADQSQETKLAIMRQFWAFFDALDTVILSAPRFDSTITGVVESDSHELVPPTSLP